MRNKIVIYPIAFALYPILYLCLHNLHTVTPRELIVPVLMISAFAILVCFLTCVLLGDKHKAGVLASAFFVLFFSYGHVYRLVNDFLMLHCAGMSLDRSIFLILWIIPFLVLSFFVVRTRRNLTTVSEAMMVAGWALVAMTAIPISIHILRQSTTVQPFPIQSEPRTPTTSPASTSVKPDIFYILLDAYARADVLKELYHYDNSEFIAFLQSKGFYVADKCYSNHNFTEPSLTAVFNLNYINDKCACGNGLSKRGLNALLAHMRSNPVTTFLKQQGYRIVAFGKFASWLANADVVQAAGWANLSDFQGMIFNITPLPALRKMVNRHDERRRRILHTLARLPKMTNLPGPLFVAAHIMCPHGPFLFGPNGERLRDTGETPDDDVNASAACRVERRKKYVDQVQFVNKRIKFVIEEILATATRPTVIVLQGDHGMRSFVDWDHPEKTVYRDCHAVLNALLLPGDGAKLLYRSISPVNTFRVIFNAYFGTKYELLQDESYFSTKYEPLKFIRSTEMLRAEEQKTHADQKETTGTRIE